MRRGSRACWLFIRNGSEAELRKLEAVSRELPSLRSKKRRVE